MNAMSGTPSLLSAEKLIVGEMEMFEETLRKALSAEAFKQANYLIAVLRDIFYYRGYVTAPGPNAEALKKIPRIAPKKQDFYFNAGAQEDRGRVNLLDILLGYINLRIKSGDLAAGRVPEAAGRWIKDIRKLASGHDMSLPRSPFMGVPAETVQWPPQPEPVPPIESFTLPDDETFDRADFSFPDEAHKALTDEQEERLFRDNLERMLEAIPSDMKALPETRRAGTMRPDSDEIEIPGLEDALRETLEEDAAPKIAAVSEQRQEEQLEIPFEAPPRVDEAAAQKDGPAALDIELDMEAFETELMSEAARLSSEASAEKVQAAIKEIRAIVAEEPSVAAPAFTPRRAALRASAEESETDIDSARRLAQKFKPLEWPPRADYSKIEPTRARKAGFLAAATSFAVTGGIMMTSRYAVVAGAIALGLNPVGAGILAGIAIGAGHTYFKNRAEILKQAENVESRWERTKVLTRGFFKCYTPSQFGLTVAGSFGGAFAADWIANNADWIAEKGSPIVKSVVDATADAFAWVGENVALAYNDLASARPEIAAQADATSNGKLKTIFVKTVPVNTDGVPMTAGMVAEPTPTAEIAQPVDVALTRPAADRFGGDFPVAADNSQSRQVIAAYQDQAKAAVEGAKAFDILQPSETQPPAYDAVNDPVAGDTAPVTSDIAQTPDTAPETKTHTVARGGRSLWNIAQDVFGVKGEATRDAVEAIIARNPDLAANPNKLSLGQKLILPASLDGAPQAECKWTRRAVTCVIPGP